MFYCSSSELFFITTSYENVSMNNTKSIQLLYSTHYGVYSFIPQFRKEEKKIISRFSVLDVNYFYPTLFLLFFNGNQVIYYSDRNNIRRTRILQYIGLTLYNKRRWLKSYQFSTADLLGLKHRESITSGPGAARRSVNNHPTDFVRSRFIRKRKSTGRDAICQLMVLS